MNIVKERFVNKAEQAEYNSLRPSYFEISQKTVTEARHNCFQLLQAFGALEYSLTKLVLHAMGLDKKQDVWKEVHADYAIKMSKIFSISEIREIIKSLEKEGLIEQSSSSENINLPSSFPQNKVDYLKALDIAFEYRNTLAHEGYILFHRKIEGEFHIFPIIEAKPHQIKNKYPSINILERTTINEKGEEIYLSFIDFVGRLVLGLPPHGVTEMRYILKNPPNTEEFFASRIEKATGTMHSMLKGKTKKLESLKARILEDYKDES